MFICHILIHFICHILILICRIIAVFILIHFRCQKILTETDNLYSVRYQSKGQGDEAEALEEQFFQIYADKQLFANLPIKVRFGEVTGIHFDASAATRDISKSGQLTAPLTLKSFGLLHIHDSVKQLIVVENAPIPEMVSHHEISSSNLIDHGVI